MHEPGPGERSQRPRSRDFAEALQRARRAGDAADRGRARAVAVDRREALDRGARILRERRAGFDERPGTVPSPRGRAGADGARPTLPRGPQAAPAAPPDPAAGFAPGVHAPALRAVLRALPPAVEAARARQGTLELAFGRALSVELRAAPGGVEVLLRPDAGLARQAAAELPALVQALRDRGVPVARAEVRRAGGRVDGPPSLR